MGHEYTRREQVTGAGFGAFFLTVAIPPGVLGGMPNPGLTGLWLTLLCVLPPAELRTAAWMYAIDVILLPISFAIALVTREVPAAAIAILPIAALHTILQRADELADRVGAAFDAPFTVGGEALSAMYAVKHRR